MALSSCNTITNQQGRELIEHGNTLFPVACYHDDLVKESVPWHWHDDLETIVVLDGTAEITAGTEKFTLKQGEGCFINSGVLHAAWAIDCSACHIHSVIFHPRLVGGSFDSIFWQNYIYPLLTNPTLKCIKLDGSEDWHPEAVQAIETAWKCCVAETYGYEFGVRSALSQLILKLSSYHPVIIKRPTEKTWRDNERIKTMLEYIQEYYYEPLTIAMIATQAMISESECLRCFRNTIGSTPIQYLKQLRIQKAAAQLISGNEKITDIGTRCGFQDSSYFIKTFREITGYTPSAYRKIKKNQSSDQKREEGTL